MFSHDFTRTRQMDIRIPDIMETSNKKGCFTMLPCQQNCSRYCAGCHKTCPEWKNFQHQQDLRRQQKKGYLKYYNELCGTRVRQFNILSPVRW